MIEVKDVLAICLACIALSTADTENQNLTYIYNGPPADLSEIPGIKFVQYNTTSKPYKNVPVPTSVIPLQKPSTSTQLSPVNGSATTARPPASTTPLGHGVVFTNRLGEPIKDEQIDIFKRISAGSQAFALELFSKFSDTLTPAGKDFMISPFSIWSLLLLVAEGAVKNSLKELQDTLHITDDTYVLRQAYKIIQNTLKVNTSTIEVSVLQAIFTDLNQPVDGDFQYIMENSYEANLIPVDFLDPIKAADLINNEVQQATRNLITHAVQPGDLSDAQLVMVSTLYFKGQWRMPFNRSQTERKPFHSEDGKVIGEVDMMFQMSNFNYTAMTELEGHVLELPYGRENRLSMLLVLPRKGVPVTKIVANLRKIGTAKIFEKLEASSVGFEDDEVEVHLPRFTTTSNFVVNSVLYEMGIRDIFDPNYAKLDKISESAYISKLLHNTKIIVNEDGTVAAAATTAEFANKAQPPKFIFDRPFVYMILEKTTNALLFCGQVLKPTTS